VSQLLGVSFYIYSKIGVLFCCACVGACVRSCDTVRFAQFVYLIFKYLNAMCVCVRPRACVRACVCLRVCCSVRRRQRSYNMFNAGSRAGDSATS
jgi:hypothetical protein